MVILLLEFYENLGGRVVVEYSNVGRNGVHVEVLHSLVSLLVPDISGFEDERARFFRIWRRNATAYVYEMFLTLFVN